MGEISAHLKGFPTSIKTLSAHLNGKNPKCPP